MTVPQKEEKNERLNGNIWGWKFSLYSLAIILITLIAALIFDDPTKNKPFLLQKKDKTEIDTTKIMDKNIEQQSKPFLKK